MHTYNEVSPKSQEILCDFSKRLLDNLSQKKERLSGYITKIYTNILSNICLKFPIDILRSAKQKSMQLQRFVQTVRKSKAAEY